MKSCLNIRNLRLVCKTSRLDETYLINILCWHCVSILCKLLCVDLTMSILAFRMYCFIYVAAKATYSFAFMAKWGFFSPSSVKRGQTHIVLGWNMSGASTSTYPENLGSGGLIPAELRGRVCRFFCPSRYDARHRKPRRCVYALNLGGMGISPPDSFSFRSSFCSRSRSPDKNPPGPGHPTSGDIFYCSGSRQLNHSSLFCVWLRLWRLL